MPHFKPEYRAWDEHLKILGKVYFMHDTGADTWEVDYEGNPGEPKTGLKLDEFIGKMDKNGRKLFRSDLVKVKRTIGNGEYTSEAVYSVEIDSLCGISLRFQSLVENGDEMNQYPVDTTLSEEHKSLCVAYRTQSYEKLAVPDCWGENQNFGTRWKRGDYSEDIEWCGTVHQNPELLRPNA